MADCQPPLGTWCLTWTSIRLSVAGGRRRTPPASLTMPCIRVMCGVRFLGCTGGDTASDPAGGRQIHIDVEDLQPIMTIQVDNALPGR